ncbi:hypothetical protein SLE2022_064520 [Rubroshorea leprosula]
MKKTAISALFLLGFLLFHYEVDAKRFMLGEKTSLQAVYAEAKMKPDDATDANNKHAEQPTNSSTSEKPVPDTKKGSNNEDEAANNGYGSFGEPSGSSSPESHRSYNNDHQPADGQ